jgi:hypothetical protein
MGRLSSRRFFVTALSLTAMAPLLSGQDLRVSAGTIEDRRTTGKFFGGLEVELKLTGDDLADAKAKRVIVKKAVDETGRDLLPDDRKEPDFSTSSGSDLKVSLKNPARGSTALKEISGHIELFTPSRDPASVVTIDRLLSRMDKPISMPALRNQQIEIAVVSPKAHRANAAKRKAEFEKEMAKNKAEMEKEMKGASAEEAKALEAIMGLAQAFSGMMDEVGDNDLILNVKDAEGRVMDVEVTRPDGEVISSNGSMSSGELRVMNFSEKLPVDAKLKVLVKTKKALVSTPFTLSNVSLP